MTKWIIYIIWMVILLNMIGENVVFPSAEIEQLLIMVFVLGSGIITAWFKGPAIGDSKE